jgi:hypothetical protein
MMTTESKTSDNELVLQEHCIDLPGESVQCWIGGGTDKLKVILWKHRDVIFDIHLGNGKTYTLESTESDFYIPRDKKLVSASKQGNATFKDGERFHAWVSRSFHGALVLKSDDRVIYKVEPDEWDQQKYSNDPKEKPAPIIITIGEAPVAATLSKKSMPQSIRTVPLKSTASTPVIAPASTGPMHATDLSCPVICVIDGKIEGMPAHIAEHFKSGGDHS